MNGLYQKYLDNLTEGHDLVKKNFHSSAKKKQDLLDQIQNHSRRTYQLRLENDEILNKLLFSRRAEDLTPQDVEELSEFADQLFEHLHQNDIGISLTVHRKLLEYAELKNDRDLRIRQLYSLGAAFYYINPHMPELGINLYCKEISHYFRLAADYLPQYEEIDDPQTRGYIIRSLTNFYTTAEDITSKHRPCVRFDEMRAFFKFDECFHKLMEIYTDPRYRRLSPDFPWDKLIYHLHFTRSLFYRFWQRYHPHEALEKMYESITYCYDHQESLAEFQYSTKEARLDYTYAAIRCRMDLIDVRELLETILNIIRHADPNDFSSNGIIFNLQMPLNLEYVYRSMSNIDKKTYRQQIRQVLHSTAEYLLKAPHNEFSNLVTHTVGESVRYRAMHGLPLQKRLFNSLLACHPPSYIHVRMTALLSRRLFERMVDTTPERLLGLFDIFDAGELRGKREELAQRVHTCSMYHDVGKIMLLDYVGIYGRKLLDEEFSAIKLHPHIGAALLKKLNPPELSAVALHHHRFYDETGGYPEDCPPCEPQYKALVDIVTVADSLEAATDNIGRCYAMPKTMATVVEELRRESGTRYSPDVVALFDDPVFLSELESELEKERGNVYYKIYCYDDLKKKNKAIAPSPV